MRVGSWCKACSSSTGDLQSTSTYLSIDTAYRVSTERSAEVNRAGYDDKAEASGKKMGKKNLVVDIKKATYTFIYVIRRLLLLLLR